MFIARLKTIVVAGNEFFALSRLNTKNSNCLIIITQQKLENCFWILENLLNFSLKNLLDKKQTYMHLKYVKS